MHVRPALAVLLAAVAGLARAEANLNVVSAVEVKDEGGSIVLTVKGSRPPNFTTFSMPDPPRFVIDLSEARFEGVPEDLIVQDGVVNVVKSLSYGSDATSIARVMIAFLVEVDPPDVQTVGETLVVRVTKPAGMAVAAAPQQPDPGAAAEAAAAELARVETERKAAAAVADRLAAEQQQALAAAEAERVAKEEQAVAEAEKARLELDERARAEAEAKAQGADALAAQADAAARADAERLEAERRAADEAVARAEAEVAARAEEQRRAREAYEAEQQSAVARAAAAAPADALAAAEAPVQPAAEPSPAAEAAPEATAAPAQEALAFEAPASDAAEPAPAEAAEVPGDAPAPSDEALAAEALVPAPRASLREVGFRQLPGISRVFVRTSVTPRYSIQDAGENVIRVELENTRVDRRNDTRFLDTSFFSSAVAMVTPMKRGSTYVVEIKLRERVPYQQRIEGDMLALDFARPAGAAGDAGANAAPPPGSDFADPLPAAAAETLPAAGR